MDSNQCDKVDQSYMTYAQDIPLNPYVQYSLHEDVLLQLQSFLQWLLPLNKTTQLFSNPLLNT